MPGWSEFSASAPSIAEVFRRRHTATQNLGDALHQRYAEALFAETGFDLRGRPFEHLYRSDIIGAAAVSVRDGHLDITVWRAGHDENVVRKH